MKLLPPVLALFLVIATPAVWAAEAALPAGAQALRDLPYVTNGAPRQKLDLFVPAQPKGPLLVWIHGGGWQAGTKSEMPGEALLAQGFTLASLEYRFSGDAIFPAQIEDCKAAIRWLRAKAAEYHYNPNRIGVWGASAGGHLTALLATTGNTHEFDVGENLDQSSAIECGIDFFGPSDFPGFIPENSDPAVQRKGPESVLTHLFGGPLDEKLDLARRASPVSWVSKESAPLYIAHGTKDPLVPLAQSRELADKYKAAGVEVTLDVIEGAGHGGAEFWTGDRIKRMLDFFVAHLGKP